MSVRMVALCLAAASAMLVGCSYIERQFDADEPSTVVSKQTRYATRVMLTSKCPSDDEAFASFGGVSQLLGFAVPLVADTIFNLIDQYLKAQQAALSATYLGQGAGPMFDANKVQCLIVARGEFGTSAGWQPRPNFSLNPDAEAAEQQKKIEALRAFGFASNPDLYFEARLVPQTGDMVALVPQFFYFGRTAAKRTGSGAKSIYIILTAKANTKAPAAADEQPDDAQSAAFALGRVAMGTSIIAPEASRGQIKQTNPLADLAVVLKKPDGDAATPLNLFVQIAETENPSAIEKALAVSYESNNSKLKAAIDTIVKQILNQGGNDKTEGEPE